MAIHAEMEIITPQIASEYLAKNTNNYRVLSKSKVDVYAEDMRNGNWQENGEGIAFGEDGTLKDGQHRLHAIIRSGVTVPMLVIRGVASNVQVYDWGTNRTSAQIARAGGYALSSDMIGAARIIISGFHSSTPKGVLDKYLREHHDELHEAGLLARHSNGNRCIGKKAACTLGVYVCQRLKIMNDDVLKDFFEVFNSGNITQDQKRDPSPALIAARMFITKYSSVSGNGIGYQYAIIMQALMDFLKNKNRRKDYVAENKFGAEYLEQIREADGV